MRTMISAVLLFVLCLAALPLRSDALPTNLIDAPYWRKAEALLQRSEQGQRLSGKEQAFLDQARSLRAKLRVQSLRRNHGENGDGTGGDNARDVMSEVPPVALPPGTSEPIALRVRAPDGAARTVFYQRPPGEGPFPAIVFIHGGLEEMTKPEMRRQLTQSPVISRFLAAGYVTVMTTFRDYKADIQSRGPILDSLAAVEMVSTLDFIDPERIAVFGGSGGGNIALELASIAPIQAVIAGEPATVIYTRMLTTGEIGPRIKVMSEPKKYFTRDLQRETLKKLKTIKVPILILHSDEDDLIHVNKDLLLPLMIQAGVDVQFSLYPGYGHGFYFGDGRNRWGLGADLSVIEAVVGDTIAFLEGSARP